MKIALLTNGIWPYVLGGMQKHSYFLCKYLSRNKIQVVLFHTQYGKNPRIQELEHFTEEEKKYITVEYIAYPKTIRFPGHYLLASYMYSKRIFRALENHNGIDFIISKSTTAWYLLKKRKSKSPPVGINIHGYEFMQKQADKRSALESWILRWPFIYVNKKADYVFSYGGGITSLIQRLGVPRHKIIELPGAIEQDWMTESVLPSSGKRKFIFVGRYERRKGIVELNEVIKHLIGKYEFEFHFIGPIPAGHQISDPSVVYHGSISEKQKLQNLLQRAHILVCPSYSEGMPNVLLEGMANGCAVIATDVGAVNGLVDDKVGWLIPAGDISSLQRAFVEAIEISDNNLNQLRQQAFDRIKKGFTWDKIVEDLKMMLQQRINNEV